jgi:transketolase
VYTHDSIGLGEDGPTHQPVEHVASLRMIPNLSVWRPCDAVESAVAWKCAIEERSGPHALVFTRQTLPHQTRDEAALAHIERGGYILRDTAGMPDAIVLATGAGRDVRVVSMPNPGRFLAQDHDYRESVLPSEVKARVAVEAGVSNYWHAFVGDGGAILGIDRFGASAPGGQLFEFYGLTVDKLVSAVNAVLESQEQE